LHPGGHRPRREVRNGRQPALRERRARRTDAAAAAARAPAPRWRASLKVLVMNWQDRLNPRAGGAEIHLHEVFVRFAAREQHVRLLVSGWAGASRCETVDGVDVHRTGGRYTFSLASPFYYRRHLQDLGFDIMIEKLNLVPLFTPLW